MVRRVWLGGTQTGPRGPARATGRRLGGAPGGLGQDRVHLRVRDSITGLLLPLPRGGPPSRRHARDVERRQRVAQARPISASGTQP
jgi:hypothetical protein